MKPENHDLKKESGKGYIKECRIGNYCVLPKYLKGKRTLAVLTTYKTFLKFETDS